MRQVLIYTRNTNDTSNHPLSNKEILPAHDRNAATIPILLARNRASLSSLSLKQQISQCG